MKSFQLILILFGLVLYSCSKSDNPILAEDEEVLLPDIPLEWTLGKNIYNIEFDGVERNFLVHVPVNYDGSQDVPLLFMLHGTSGTGEKFYNKSGWVQKSEEEGFIAVFPTALKFKMKESGRTVTKWSSPGGKKDVVDSTLMKDDMLFLDGLLDALIDNFSIDESRIYACGFSNGGGFVRSEILTRWSERVAAIASAGGFGVVDPIVIPSERYLPLFSIVGSADPKLLENMPDLDKIPLTVDKIKEHELLKARLEGQLATLKLGTSHTEEPNRPAYNNIIFQDDLTGQGNEFVLQIVSQMEHNFPNGKNNPKEVKAVDYLWPWFMRFKKD